MSSVAEGAIISMQDFLGLDERARFNKPSTAKGNWEWRLEEGQVNSQLADSIHDKWEIYGRMD